MRKYIIFLAFALLLLGLLTLTGCTDNNDALTPSTEPLVFASPYLAYIGEKQSEWLPKSGLNDENSTSIFDRRRTAVTVDGMEYELTLLFDWLPKNLPDAEGQSAFDKNWLDNTILGAFVYKLSFDRAEFPEYPETLEKIYSALCAEYGEPVDFSGGNNPITDFLKKAEEVPKTVGSAMDCWLLTDTFEYPIKGFGPYLYAELTVKIQSDGNESFIQIRYSFSEQRRGTYTP